MALLGTLQVRMGLDTATFTQGFSRFQKNLTRRVAKFQRSIRGLTSFGAAGGSFAAGLGLKNVIRVAADFEESMNGVRAVLSGLTAGEFVQLREEARRLGRETKFTARESAAAIEVLAKNGLKTGQILGGALEKSLQLAASTGSEITESADLTTDVLNIFQKDVGELGNVIDQVNSVIINSKFGFEDYRLALATGGPAAVKAGKSFEEFNATIAATASFFASGETAGTAFKVFTDKLVNDSTAAQIAQEKLGVSFFDNNGKMRDLAEIAGQLQKAFAGLSDEDRIRSTVDQFGTRGANAAAALSRAGKEGINTARSLIAQANAAEQARIRMEGFAGAAARFRSAVESLGIALADSGILDAFTGLLEKLIPLINKFEAAPKSFKFAAVGFLIVAAAAPLGFALSGLAGLLPVVVGAFGLLIKPLLKSAGSLGIFAKAGRLLGKAFAVPAALIALPKIFGRLSKSVGIFIARLAPVRGLIFRVAAGVVVDWEKVFGEILTAAVKALTHVIVRLATSSTS